jgi:hypothetical protein
VDPLISNARRLATTLFDAWDDALLFRNLATLRLDAPVFESGRPIHHRDAEAQRRRYKAH